MGDWLMDLLQGGMTALDTPGSMLRAGLAGEWERMFTGIGDPSQRVGGGEVLENLFGVQDPSDTASLLTELGLGLIPLGAGAYGGVKLGKKLLGLRSPAAEVGETIVKGAVPKAKRGWGIPLFGGSDPPAPQMWSGNLDELGQAGPLYRSRLAEASESLKPGMEFTSPEELLTALDKTKKPFSKQEFEESALRGDTELYGPKGDTIDTDLAQTIARNRTSPPNLTETRYPNWSVEDADPRIGNAPVPDGKIYGTFATQQEARQLVDKMNLESTTKPVKLEFSPRMTSVDSEGGKYHIAYPSGGPVTNFENRYTIYENPEGEFFLQGPPSVAARNRASDIAFGRIAPETRDEEILAAGSMSTEEFVSSQRPVVKYPNMVAAKNAAQLHYEELHNAGYVRGESKYRIHQNPAKYRKYSSGGEHGPGDYGEVLVQIPGVGYKHGHFPNQQDFFAHYRYTANKPLPTGGKAFNIEEWQSDLHQAGQTWGYKGDTPKVTWEEIPGSQPYNMTKVVGRFPNGDGSLVIYKRGDKWTINTPDEGPKHFSSLEEAKEWAGPIIQEDARMAQPPSAPFKGGAWQKVVLGRAVRDAIDKGHNTITWNPGVLNFYNMGGTLKGQLYNYDEMAPSQFKKWFGVKPEKMYDLELDVDGIYSRMQQSIERLTDQGKGGAQVTKEMEAFKKLLEKHGTPVAKPVLPYKGTKARAEEVMHMVGDRVSNPWEQALATGMITKPEFMNGEVSDLVLLTLNYKPKIKVPVMGFDIPLAKAKDIYQRGTELMQLGGVAGGGLAALGAALQQSRQQREQQ